LREQYKGSRFHELVQHQLRRQSQERRAHGILGTILRLPESARALAEGFIDRWNARAYDREFWQTDTDAVFDEIIDDARTVLRPLGFAMDDEAAFNLFNIVVLSYAYSAYDQPEMREFMGISPAMWRARLRTLAIYLMAGLGHPHPSRPELAARVWNVMLGISVVVVGVAAGMNVDTPKDFVALVALGGLSCGSIFTSARLRLYGGGIPPLRTILAKCVWFASRIGVVALLAALIRLLAGG
jgi:hypothetical protein